MLRLMLILPAAGNATGGSGSNTGGGWFGCFSGNAVGGNGGSATGGSVTF